MKSLTAKEEEIMGIFWKKGPLFVKQLMETFGEPKPHYNTLSTFVRGLEEKKYLAYNAYGNTYQYFPLISEVDYRKKTLKNVISRYFDNSYTSAVSTLIEEEKISIEELEDLIRQVKKQGK
jgi:predicted transcriptional regulator